MLRDDQLTALKKIVGDTHVSTGESERALHSHDQSSHPAHLPDAVVRPATTEEVSQLAAYANSQRLPLVGWGAGSSLEGNPIPLRGGLVVSFSRMNQILDLYAEDFQVTVQPGILYKDMNRSLGRHGLFFAPDPGANASIGGMIANNAAGTRTVKYGATRDNVLALEVVLASGEILRTGSRSVKQSAGYDLTHLFIGSEGTLGLITAATLRLAPLPEHLSAATAAFPSTEAAAAAVFGIIGAGLNPAALELLDTATIQAINRHDGFDLVEAPNLFLEFHGASEAALAAELEDVRDICRACGAAVFTPGLGRDARDRLWASRHALGDLLFRLHPDHSYLITDVAVPISRYPSLVASATDALRQLGDDIPGFIFGHAGDGNMHSIIFFDADDHDRVQRDFNDRIVAKAIELGGTCTGEHGVGIGKQKYLTHEHGETAVGVMRQIKRLLDPNDILNPGKVVPAAG